MVHNIGNKYIKWLKLCNIESEDICDDVFGEARGCFSRFTTSYMQNIAEDGVSVHF